MLLFLWWREDHDWSVGLFAIRGGPDFTTKSRIRQDIGHFWYGSTSIGVGFLPYSENIFPHFLILHVIFYTKFFLVVK